MRFIKAATFLICLVGLASLAQPSVAQFSDTWEFLKAVEDADYEEMRKRISNGANVNAYNGDGLTAVIIATDLRNTRLLTFLVENGASVNRSARETGETALMRAAERGNTEIARFLLENGADVNAEDRRGETALMKAARARKRTIVSLLLGYDVDIDQTDYTGKTALAYARESRARSVERLLVDAGASF